MSLTYEKPYCRISPYLVGMVTGYLLLHAKDWRLPRKVRNWQSCHIHVDGQFTRRTVRVVFPLLVEVSLLACFSQLVSRSASRKSVSQLVSQLVSQSVSQSVSSLVSQSASQSVSQSVSQLVSQLVSQSIIQ